MRKNALASSLVAVGMMAVAFMVVAFLRTTRVEEPEGSEAGVTSDPGSGGRAARGSEGAARERSDGRPSGRGSVGEARSANRRGGVTRGAPATPPEALSDGGEPRIDVEELQTEPWPLTAEGIQAAVNSQIEHIKHCYDQWLELEPDIAGSVVVTFTVAEGEGGGGEVTGLELADSELDHPFIEGCVLNVFQEMPFEPPADGGQVEIDYPLMFDSQGDEEATEE